MTAVCKHVLYSGRVQGVGFRFTVQHLAEHFPVAGYVRNLPSGQVELVAEGPGEQVEAFLAAVANRMADYIDGAAEKEEMLAGHKGFRVRY